MQFSHTGKNILTYMASSITSFYLPSAYFFKATGATVHDILHKKVLWLETLFNGMWTHTHSQVFTAVHAKNNSLLSAGFLLVR